MKTFIFLISSLFVTSFSHTMELEEPKSIESDKLTLTDKNGTAFKLTPEQATAFAKCSIFRDFKESESVNEHSHLIARRLNQLDEKASYDEVKDCQKQVSQELIESCQALTLNDQRKEWNFSACNNPNLTAGKITRLLNFIHNNETIKALYTFEYADLFELALYIGAPEDKIEILAQKFYEHIDKIDEERLHPSVKYFKQYAVKYLPYYPDMNAFIEDFKMQIKKDSKLHRNLLLKDSSCNHPHPYALSVNLDISYTHLQQLGFTKKIHSLNGIETLKNYLDCRGICKMDCAGQAISDFNCGNLQRIFSRLHVLYLNNTNISHLQKHQFAMIRPCYVHLDNNPITTIDDDCFSLICNEPDIYISMSTVKKEQLQKIYIPLSPLSKVKQIAQFYLSKRECKMFGAGAAAAFSIYAVEIMFLQKISKNYPIIAQKFSLDKLGNFESAPLMPSLGFFITPIISQICAMRYTETRISVESDAAIHLIIRYAEGTATFKYFSDKPTF